LLLALLHSGNPKIAGYLVREAFTHPTGIHDLIAMGNVAASAPFTQCDALHDRTLVAVAHSAPLPDVGLIFQRSAALCDARTQPQAISSLEQIAGEQAKLHRDVNPARFVASSLLEDARVLQPIAPAQSVRATSAAWLLLHRTAALENTIK
jgi:hypothetical protein